ncbi:MAG: GTP-sensing pleiotropic transcriptional regulator CodY [Eubacterium sp.]|nr:GTP-sensing pleiotropic transcriptional regulator CodY [Eubacterium sp.]MBR1675040.1 GTP-sensing pleiotropic transcriptional regulator CodY [Eubacterium sp.]
MSVHLLDKTRKLNKLLHNNSSYKVIFNDICKCAGEILNANVLVVSLKGKVLGIYGNEGIRAIHELLADSIGEVIDESLNERFLSVLSTKENVNLMTLGFEKTSDKDFSAIVMPVDFAGERLGTTFIYREKESFDVDDIIFSEYMNTVIELEMMRSIYEEDEDERRKHIMVRSATESLSVSEKDAMVCVFKEMDKKEGLLVASRVATKYRITRSIIVNALKKLEGAGIIESRSQGMRGTYIRIINDAIFEELGM